MAMCLIWRRHGFAIRNLFSWNLHSCYMFVPRPCALPLRWSGTWPRNESDCHREQWFPSGILFAYMQWFAAFHWTALQTSCSQVVQEQRFPTSFGAQSWVAGCPEAKHRPKQLAGTMPARERVKLVRSLWLGLTGWVVGFGGRWGRVVWREVQRIAMATVKKQSSHCESLWLDVI